MTQRTKVWFWGMILVGCAAVLITAFLLDPIVADWMRNHRSHDLRIVMGAVSRYGDWPEHVLVGIVLLAIAWRRKNTRWARIFLAMLIACAIAGAAARVIKIGTGRARPSVKTELAWNGPRLSEKYHAFPSGHTAASTAFFAVLAFVSWRIGLACAAIPLLIGFSRMCVAAHYLSDVVFAAFLGVICAYAVVKAMKLTAVPHREVLNVAIR